MSLEVTLGIVVIGIIVLSFLLGLLPKREPKEKHFNCSRCGAFSQHNSRTIEAWRNKKNQFFCQNCHSKWLQSRSRQELQRTGNRTLKGGEAGCLGFVFLVVLTPLAGYLLIRLCI